MTAAAPLLLATAAGTILPALLGGKAKAPDIPAAPPPPPRIGDAALAERRKKSVAARKGFGDTVLSRSFGLGPDSNRPPAQTAGRPLNGPGTTVGAGGSLLGGQ